MIKLAIILNALVLLAGVKITMEGYHGHLALLLAMATVSINVTIAAQNGSKLKENSKYSDEVIHPDKKEVG